MRKNFSVDKHKSTQGTNSDSDDLDMNLQSDDDHHENNLDQFLSDDEKDNNRNNSSNSHTTIQKKPKTRLVLQDEELDSDFISITSRQPKSEIATGRSAASSNAPMLDPASDSQQSVSQSTRVSHHQPQQQPTHNKNPSKNPANLQQQRSSQSQASQGTMGTFTTNSTPVTRSDQTAPTEDSGIDFVFVCKVDNIHNVSKVLSALASTQKKKEQQKAIVTISNSGIKFTVEESKNFQGSVMLGEEIFQEFKFSGNLEQFCINYSILLDCLTIYGASSPFVAMQMAYGGYGHALVLMLEENGVVTNCGIKTLDVETRPLNYNFREVAIPTRVILEASYLKDAFNELDWSCPSVTLTMSPEAPFFRLETRGPSGSFQVDYPRDSEVFETFECEQTLSQRYKLSLLQSSVAALKLTSKVQVRINAVGILNLQHMIKTEDKNITFVDFYVIPEDDDV